MNWMWKLTFSDVALSILHCISETGINYVPCTVPLKIKYLKKFPPKPYKSEIALYHPPTLILGIKQFSQAHYPLQSTA